MNYDVALQKRVAAAAAWHERHGGVDGRLLQLAEESSEMAQACCKMLRDDVDHDIVYNNFIEELADVQIMIDEVVGLYRCKAAVEAMIEAKIKRDEQHRMFKDTLVAAKAGKKE